MLRAVEIRKILKGDGAERYLPVALSKLRHFEASWHGFPLSTNLIVEDGTIIMVQLSNEGVGQIVITASSGDYEYFTTGKTFSIGAHNGFPTYRGYAVRVKLDKGKLTLKGEELGSTVSDTVSPEKMTAILRYKNIWQVQGAVSHAFFSTVPGADSERKFAKEFLVSSWSQANQYNHIFVKSGVNYENTLDFQYDVRPGYFSAPGKPKGGAPDADWYRRACTQTVTHPAYGSRTFIILTDVTNSFYAYPLGVNDESLSDSDPYAAQNSHTNVPPEVTRKATPTYPAGVRGATTEQARNTTLTNYFNTTLTFFAKYPLYRWAFNSTGTRAATIAFKEMPPLRLQDGFPLAVGNSEGGVANLSIDLPGVLELDLQIEITGPNPEDFTFTIATRQYKDPTNSDKWPLAVDYAWKVGEVTNLDDLVILNAGVYYPTGAVLFTSYYEAFGSFAPYDWTTATLTTDEQRVQAYYSDPTYRSPDQLVVVTVENLTQSSVIRQLFHRRTDSLAFAKERALIQSHDLRILAFVVQKDYFTRDIVGLGVSQLFDLVDVRRATKLEVWTYNVLEETKYVEPESELNGALDTACAPVSLSGMSRYDPLTMGNPKNEYFVRDTFRRSIAAISSLFNVTNSEMQSQYGTNVNLDCISQPFFSNLFSSNTVGHRSYVGEDKFDCSLPIGALVYQVATASLHAGQPQEMFSVHPDGHWSVSTFPTLVYTGKSRMGIRFSNFNSNHIPVTMEMVTKLINPMGGTLETTSDAARSADNLALVTIDINKFRQAYIDVVCMRADGPDGNKVSVKSTHLALTNQALGASFEATDYNNTLERFDTLFPVYAAIYVGYGLPRINYVKVSGSNVPDSYFWGINYFPDRKNEPGFAYVTSNSPGLVISYNMPCYFDNRTGYGFYQLPPDDPSITAVVGVSSPMRSIAVSNARKTFAARGPLVRGSSLFAGKKK